MNGHIAYLWLAVTAGTGLAVGVALGGRRFSRKLRAEIGRLAASPGVGEADTLPPKATELSSSINRALTHLSDEALSAGHALQARDLILSSMEEGILLSGAGGGVIYTNTSLDTLLGKGHDSIHSLSPAALREVVADAGAGRESDPVEVEMGSPRRWLRCSAAPVGNDGSMLLVIRDITESKRMDAVRRDFVTNASHELKSPVAAIRAAAETIRSASREDAAAVPRFAEQLERDAIRLSRIISDLLDLSRLESGSELADAVRLDEIVRDESEQFRTTAGELGLSIRMDTETALVQGSERDLRLLARNLVDNAVRYAKESGEVVVTVSAIDDSCILRVRDTGVGIPSRDLPRVFERFYRVDRARSRDTGGTGLGLAIVKHVAENHGGSVGIESELGSGTEIEVRLPAMQTAPPA
jgi:two-component system phosphate regulon sensor histidine kinase PhoR